MYERIGKITETFLGFGDHGIFTFYLTFDFGDSKLGFGGYRIDNFDLKIKRRIVEADGMDLLIRVLGACDVSSWEKIKGKTMYALCDDDELGQKIIGIKNLPFEPGGQFLIKEWQDKWFPNEK